jgi:valyl-tRNA synthetase
VPFRDVAIHCTVLSRDGRIMKKSRPETVVDPRDVIERSGADALRAWCAQVAVAAQDVRFDDRRIEGYRRFGNKLWNATRLVLGALGEAGLGVPPALPPERGDLWLADRWMLSRVQAAARDVTRGIEAFVFHHAVEAVHHCAWHELCDWYLEAAKARLRRGDPVALGVALHALDTVLRLLHPFMPFVTEELWHRLPGARDFLVSHAWPAVDDRFTDPEAEREFAGLQAAIEAARQARGKLANPQSRAKLTPEQTAAEEQRAGALAAALGHLQSAR